MNQVPYDISSMVRFTVSDAFQKAVKLYVPLSYEIVETLYNLSLVEYKKFPDKFGKLDIETTVREITDNLFNKPF